MIAIRVKSSGSWLDPECSGIIGWKFGRRLWQQVQGRKGLFITLTYRRDEYLSGKDLYHRQKDEQHVPLFMRRLSRALGRSLKGRWVCKMEFQEAGWTHWHIILLDIARIEHELLARCWGHGFVKVKALTKKRVFYMTKYVAKNGKLPFWLYNERPRSVKIIRVSPGFWGVTKPMTKSEEPPPMKIDVYVSIGQRLLRKGVVISLGNGRRFSRRCEPGRVLCLLGMQYPSLGKQEGWLVYDATMDQLLEVIKQAVEWEQLAREAKRTASSAGRGPERASSAAGRAAAVNLRGTSNPDAERWDHLPWWTKAELEEEARQMFEPQDVGTTIGRWC